MMTIFLFGFWHLFNRFFAVIIIRVYVYVSLATVFSAQNSVAYSL